MDLPASNIIAWVPDFFTRYFTVEAGVCGFLFAFAALILEIAVAVSSKKASNAEQFLRAFAHAGSGWKLLTLESGSTTSSRD